MIRTRDLLLFVTIIVFLLMAIFATISSNREKNKVPTMIFSDAISEENISGAEHQDVVIDRSSIIARLREAIKGEDAIITTSVPEDTHDVDAMPDDDASAVAGTIIWCDAKRDAIAFARTWPRENVAVSVAPPLLLVEAVTEVPRAMETAHDGSVTSSSTNSVEQESDIVRRPLLQTLADPIASTPSCLSSEIIGVTIEGSLLFNSDAIAYYGRGEDELIGYARDGYPVYGNYTGETDACGGYEKYGTYRYTVSQNRTFILGCYTASPQSFVGELDSA